VAGEGEPGAGFRFYGVPGGQGDRALWQVLNCAKLAQSGGGIEKFVGASGTRGVVARQSRVGVRARRWAAREVCEEWRRSFCAFAP